MNLSSFTPGGAAADAVMGVLKALPWKWILLGLAVAGAVWYVLALRSERDEYQQKWTNAEAQIAEAVAANKNQTEVIRYLEWSRDRSDEMVRSANVRRDRAAQNYNKLEKEFQNAPDALQPAGPAFDRAAERLRDLDASSNKD